MTFVAALILLCIAVALVASVAVAVITRPRQTELDYDRSAEGTGPVESELLRRPLRSRYGA